MRPWSRSSSRGCDGFTGLRALPLGGVSVPRPTARQTATMRRRRAGRGQRLGSGHDATRPRLGRVGGGVAWLGLSLVILAAGSVVGAVVAALAGR
jgi:hypothetical protein